MTDRNTPSSGGKSTDVTSASKTVTYKRYRFNVPNADESTLAWIDAQVNLSTSLRQLNRAEIERSGYVDMMCTPVTQLPKVGRPVGSRTKDSNQESASELVEDKTEAQSVTQQEIAQTSVTQQPAPPPSVPVVPKPVAQAPVSQKTSLVDDYPQERGTANAASMILEGLPI